MLSAIGAAFDPLMGMLTVVQVDLKAAQQATVNDHSQSIAELRGSVQPADLAGQCARVHFQQHLPPVGGVLSVDDP